MIEKDKHVPNCQVVSDIEDEEFYAVYDNTKPEFGGVDIKGVREFVVTVLTSIVGANSYKTNRRR